MCAGKTTASEQSSPREKKAGGYNQQGYRGDKLFRTQPWELTSHLTPAPNARHGATGFVYTHQCVCVCVCVCVYMPWHTWRGEDNLWLSVLSFPLVYGSLESNSVVRFGSKCLYALSHLAKQENIYKI